MCGITGIFEKFRGNSLEKKIAMMTNQLVHRGPDNIKTLFDEKINFAFGATRLSILDLNHRSNQPLISKNNGNIITYNGEIYNYKSIKKDLELLGIKFFTDSDTEVLLEGYNYYGGAILEKLEGMFSFVIWDKKKNIFFGARDRLGIKPFVYYKDQNRFIFSSEIDPIVSCYPDLKKIKHSSVVDIINYGVVLQPETIFENIFFLKPGHFIKVNLNMEMECGKYWDIDNFLNKDISFTNHQEYLDCLNFNIFKSIKKQLVSDVSIGSFLSGGLDSSVISLITSKILNKRINNFNIYFDNENEMFNESADGESISSLTNGNYNTQYISEEDAFEKILEYVNIIDQPSCDGLNTFLVSQTVKKKNKICLSGLGADEIFFGYGIHLDYLKAKTRKGNFKDIIMSKLFDYRKNNLCLDSYFNLLSTEEYFLILRKILNTKEKLILNKDFYKGESDHFCRKFQEYDNKNKDLKKRIFSFDLKNYLTNTLLRDSDVASMSNSIELRPVFLDHKLVELAASTTQYAQIEYDNSKIALRNIYKKRTNLTYKNKKKGFEIPYFKWLKNKKIYNLLNDLINKKNSIYHDVYLKNLKNNLHNYNYQKEVYNFLILNLWLDKKKIIL
jgi:asparagine synthase (glutamine-hydrolysing)